MSVYRFSRFQRMKRVFEENLKTDDRTVWEMQRDWCLRFGEPISAFWSALPKEEKDRYEAVYGEALHRWIGGDEPCQTPKKP